MPFPATLTLVTVSIQCDAPPGGTAAGWFTFTMRKPLLGGTDNSIVPPFTLRADLTPSTGAATIQLPATNDPQWSPSGQTYDVEAVVNGRTITGTLALDYQTASVNLADLLNVDGAASSGVSYLLTSQRSAALGVAGLDADGDVIDAFGNKITGGGGGSGTPSSSVVSETAFGQSSTAGAATAYSRGDHTHGTPSLGTSGATACAGNDSRLSDARTPTAHASSHASAGSDPVALAASQIESGTLALARIPTGTTSATVALGDAPAGAVTTHVAASDPHTQYRRTYFETTGTYAIATGARDFIGADDPAGKGFTLADGDKWYQV